MMLVTAVLAAAQANPDALVVLAGDLNDTPGSETLQLIQQGTPQLQDLLQSQPADERYTYIFEGNKERTGKTLYNHACSPGCISHRR